MTGLGTIGAYLLVVVLGSPAVEPTLAVRLALQLNGLSIAGISTVFGLQGALLVYSRQVACPARKTGTTGVSSSVFAGFTSLFSLASVGCCGLFAFWVALLLGAGAAAFLVEFSNLLTGVGLGVMALSVGLLARSIRRCQRLPASIHKLGVSTRP